MKLFNKILLIILVFLIYYYSSFGQDQNKNQPFSIRFLTWGALPFKRQILEDNINQIIINSIRNEFKTYYEIANYTSIPIDTVINRMNQISQLDLVITDVTLTDKWIANIPIYTENEIHLAEKICKKYAKKEADIFQHSLEDIVELYRSLNISKYFDWEKMSWIIIGAFISDLIVIDRIRFFQEFRDEKFLPQLHPKGRRWSLTGFINFDNIALEESKWSFYQSYVKDTSSGFSRFGYFRPKENRKKPPKNTLYLALTEFGDILFNINVTPLSFEDIIKATGMHRDTLKKRIDYLSNLNPPAILISDGKYVSNIPIFEKNDFKKLLQLGDEIATKIHTDIIIPCEEELIRKSKELGLVHPLSGGVLTRDISLKLLVKEGILPALPSPPIPWNFGVWGWQGKFLLWEDVKK